MSKFSHPRALIVLIGAAAVVAADMAAYMLTGLGPQQPLVPPPPATDASASVETPVGLIRNEPGASPGYTLFGTRTGITFLIDNAGRMIHRWEKPGALALFNSKLQPNGDLTGGIGVGKGIQRLDPDSNVVWRYLTPDKQHHDHLLLPNGNVLLLLKGTKSKDEVVAAGGNPAFIHDGGLKYDYLIEVRPVLPDGGEIVWRWSVWDHLVQDFDPGKPNYGVVAHHPELVDLNFLLQPLSRNANRNSRAGMVLRNWLHSNAIDHHAEADQVLILARNFSEVWVVDHSTTPEQSTGHSGGDHGRGGDLLYRWGNPRAHRAGAAADQRLFWPHNAHWIAPGLPGAGNILVFNNGDEFEGFFRDHSTVLEVAYPLADGRFGAWPPGRRLPPDQATWRYMADPPSDFLSHRLSGAQRLPNGNTLIVSGQQGTIFEVTPSGREVWRYVSPVVRGERLFQGDLMPMVTHSTPTPLWGNFLYRAVRYPPDYPGLQALDLTPKGTIERYR